MCVETKIMPTGGVTDRNQIDIRKQTIEILANYPSRTTCQNTIVY